MHRLSTIAFLGMLALTMAGCGSGSEENSASTPSVPPVVTTQPTTQPFEKPPLVAQNPSVVISSAPGLIQPTNSNQRAQQVSKGRKDPFAALFKPLVVRPPRNVNQVPSLPVAGAPQNAVGSSSSGSSTKVSSTSRQPNTGKPTTGAPSPNTNSQPNSGNTADQPNANRPNVLPPPLSPSSPEQFLPPPPQEPDLAQAVAIMGVVQIGDGITQAIVKVPNEATSRYVSVGQRLSNGQVLVKRIEMYEGSEPVVILEQYGVEVAKAVGEEPVESSETDTPTNDAAAIPAPPPLNEVSPEA